MFYVLTGDEDAVGGGLLVLVGVDVEQGECFVLLLVACIVPAVGEVVYGHDLAYVLVCGLGGGA